jgi:tetratricopeptide (TPR) repeat protein
MPYHNPCVDIPSARFCKEIAMSSCPAVRACVWSVLAVGICLWAAGAPAEPKYKSYQEAFSAGATAYNARKFAEAEEPFEAALKLTEETKDKLRIYKALMASYRLDKEIDQMTTAVEYIITNSTSPAEQSLTRRSYMSFIHERGRTADVVKRYEERLKTDPRNRTALFLLSEIYAELTRQPEKSAALVERLAALDKQSGKPADVRQQAQLAQQYVRAKKFKEGAELFEAIAPLDESLAAWHLKEAADAWLKAGNNKKALAAAKKSEKSKPETRSELLTYFWHKALADTFLKAGEPKSAIPHYEKAIGKTTIEGYLKDCQAKLAEAKREAGGEE